ncbi:iron-containing redox enzyme family protein [Arthrobacter sp. AL12]|uniref:iron-containing redox enzyme family protein n=1 Tax=Arthrobacter sp. AL12 TaxID=3042241 RepID=UPI00249A75E6|nr:iron-containing redox enzyme family protein [Arthrobacter sp. AL12]MDI3213052.1 iron-containing redox enzyme family protein [Arthrobacter sp. AL12]
MPIPHVRGPISAGLFRLLAGSPGDDPAAQAALQDLAAARLPDIEDVIEDGDVQLTLFCLYELHYGGLDGVTDRWEWNPGLIALRQLLEEPFERTLRDAALPYEGPAQLDSAQPDSAAGLDSDAVADILFGLAAQDGGPGMSRHVAKKATLKQLREFLIHKSIYQLKEADPHTWAIPRLHGRAKAALVEIQADEYGGGRPDRMHSTLFARTMRGLGLDDRYGAYADAVPPVSLASVNVMSLFGLNRRLRGAVAGHLAIYEMTSSRPNQLYGNGFRRLGFGADVTAYFDEHVEADAVHEQIAGRDLAGGLVESEPELFPDVLFGATAVMAIDDRLTLHIMGAWDDGESSLRAAVPAAV